METRNICEVPELDKETDANVLVEKDGALKRSGRLSYIAGVVAQLVKDFQATVSDLNARISNIVANGTVTEGNTELIDIRKGVNGTVYTTAGDAVREQVQGLQNARNYPYPFTGTGAYALVRPSDSTPIYTEEMCGIKRLTVYAESGDAQKYYMSQLYSYSTSGNCCMYINREDGGRYGVMKRAVEDSSNRGVESFVLYDQDGELLAEAVVDWDKIITNVGVGLTIESTEIQEGCIRRWTADCGDKLAACLSGVETTVTADNYADILPSMDNAEVNRICLIVGAPVENNPAGTDNVGGTLETLANGTGSPTNGTVQRFTDRYGATYKRHMWSQAWTAWRLESTWGKLAGKSLYCDGDSIAAGAAKGTDYWQTPYGNQIAEKYGMTLTNAAVSGTTLAIQEGRTDSILERVQNINAAGIPYDYIVLDGGINDVFYYESVPLGDVSTSYADTYDTSTTLGALEEICRLLLTKQPDAKKLFVLTHLSVGKASIQDTYFDGIRQVLEKWGIPYVDLRKQSGIIPLNDTLKSKWFYVKADGTQDDYHPTTETYKAVYVPLVEDAMMSL